MSDPALGATHAAVAMRFLRAGRATTLPKEQAPGPSIWQSGKVSPRRPLFPALPPPSKPKMGTIMREIRRI